MEEIWRDISGYEGAYQVSNCGRVKSFKNGERILKLRTDHNGYLFVGLYTDGKQNFYKVHRLVAQAFISNPLDKPQINHRDGNKTNNRAENLEWCTSSENTQHAFDTGLRKSKGGEDCYKAKLTNEQICYIRENPDGLSGRQLAKKFGVCPQTISNVQCGKGYKNADGTIRKPQPQTPKISYEVREEIRQLYVHGSHEFGCYGLAKKYGCRPSTILYIVNEK